MLATIQFRVFFLSSKTEILKYKKAVILTAILYGWEATNSQFL
jgi:hypothetical protein